jgi:hypothetical protein
VRCVNRKAGDRDVPARIDLKLIVHRSTNLIYSLFIRVGCVCLSRCYSDIQDEEKEEKRDSMLGSVVSRL